MAISEYYSDEELISQLQSFFEVSENIDYNALLTLLTDYDENTYELRVNGKILHIDKTICSVEEVE